MPFCTKCGNKIDDGLSFCTECGNPVAKPAQQPAPAAETAVIDNPAPAAETAVIEAEVDSAAETVVLAADSNDAAASVDEVEAPYETTVVNVPGFMDDLEEAPTAPEAYQAPSTSSYTDLSGLDRSVYEGILDDEISSAQTEVISQMPAASTGFCMSCGAPKVAGLKFCTACGASYDNPMAGAASAATYQAPYQDNYMAQGAYAPASMAPGAEQLKGGNAKLIAIIAAIALVAGLAVAFILVDPLNLFNSSSSSPSASAPAADEESDDEEASGEEESSDSESASEASSASSSTEASSASASSSASSASSSSASTSSASASSSASSASASSASASSSASSASASSASASASSASASSASAQPSETYILPESNTRYLTKSELESMSTYDLYLGRNEIYARHGRGFVNEDLQKYFNSQSWYKRTVEPGDFKDTVLNDYEKKNAELILEVEYSKNSPYAPK